ncbi:MAG: hypothetical protein R2854_03400 [Caldilineaceae bacterium]
MDVKERLADAGVPVRIPATDLLNFREPRPPGRKHDGQTFMTHPLLAAHTQLDAASLADAVNFDAPAWFPPWSRTSTPAAHHAGVDGPGEPTAHHRPG